MHQDNVTLVCSYNIDKDALIPMSPHDERKVYSRLTAMSFTYAAAGSINSAPPRVCLASQVEAGLN